MKTAETTAAALMTEASGGIGTVYAIPERWAPQQVEQRIRPISGGTQAMEKGIMIKDFNVSEKRHGCTGCSAFSDG